MELIYLTAVIICDGYNYIRMAILKKENRWIFDTMLVSALLSLVAALVLFVEAKLFARNPDAQLLGEPKWSMASHWRSIPIVKKNGLLK